MGEKYVQCEIYLGFTEGKKISKKLYGRGGGGEEIIKSAVWMKEDIRFSEEE